MLNIDNFVSRLQHILAYYNVSPSAFADTIEVQRSSISHILSGRNKASIEFILKIANTYPGIDIEWLLGRKTDFLKAVESEKKSVRRSDLDHAKTLDSISSVVPDTNEYKQDKTIEKIIVFYTDKTFVTYNPE